MWKYVCGQLQECKGPKKRENEEIEDVKPCSNKGYGKPNKGPQG